MSEAGPILHFLVIAAASRGARFFIKKALLQRTLGHSALSGRGRQSSAQMH